MGSNTSSSTGICPKATWCRAMATGCSHNTWTLRPGRHFTAAATIRSPPEILPTLFPFGKEPQTPAADVLLALSKSKDNRQLLLAAAARPHGAVLDQLRRRRRNVVPHLPRIKTCSQYLSLHATAALKAKDRIRA